MTYIELKRKVLELMNQYSVAGTAISPAYNNQSDYIRRIPGLLNDALLRIRTEARPRVATHSFSNDGQRYGDKRVFSLPHGYRGIKTGGVYRIVDGKFEPFGQYRLLGESSILFPDDNASYMIEYYADPDYLPADPFDEYSVDEDPEILTAACYFAAAMLVVDKNEYHYAALYNEFTRRLTGLVRPQTAEITPIARPMAATKNRETHTLLMCYNAHRKSEANPKGAFQSKGVCLHVRYYGAVCR